MKRRPIQTEIVQRHDAGNGRGESVLAWPAVRDTIPGLFERAKAGNDCAKARLFELARTQGDHERDRETRNDGRLEPPPRGRTS